jgi:CheY-like chemotaxis protein
LGKNETEKGRTGEKTERENGRIGEKFPVSPIPPFSLSPSPRFSDSYSQRKEEIMETNEVEILLIEDDPHDAELAIRALKKNNLANKLIWVKDGAEALDFMFARGVYSNREVNHTPKVVLLDLRLPKVDGMEVLEKIRSDERTKHTPVVVLTSSKEDIDVVNAYKLSVNSYIGKPVNFDEFSKTVAELGLYWLLLNKPPR